MKKNLLYFGLTFIFTLMIIALANNNISPITGHAVYDVNQVEQKLNEFGSSTVFKMLGNGAFFCVIIEDGSLTDSFVVAKSQGQLIVNHTTCGGPGEENVIIKFNSYDYFNEAFENPKKFIIEKRNVGYYIFPSKYVLPGGEVQCGYYFQMKYCRGLHALLDANEITALGLPCCSSFSPTGMAYGIAFITENWWLPLIILLFIIIILLFLSRPKKERR